MQIKFKILLLLLVFGLTACTTQPKKPEDDQKPLAESLTKEAQFEFALDLVNLQIERKDYAAAESLLMKLRREQGDDIRIYRLLGEVYLLQDKLELSYTSWMQVIDFKERNLKDEASFADVALKLDKFSEAEEIYQAWLSSDKRQTQVAGYNNLGFAQLLQQNLPKAKEYFLQALVVDPLNETARANMDFTLSLEEVNDEKVSK